MEEKSFNIDFSGEEYSDFTVVPKNYYNAVVVSCELMTSQSSGKNYFKWTLKTENNDGFNGVSLIANTTTIKGKRWLFKQALEACGIKEKDGKYVFKYSDVVGKKVKIFVDVEKFTKYNGDEVDVNRVTKFLNREYVIKNKAEKKESTKEDSFIKISDKDTDYDNSIPF